MTVVRGGKLDRQPRSCSPLAACLPLEEGHQNKHPSNSSKGAKQLSDSVVANLNGVITYRCLLFINTFWLVWAVDRIYLVGNIGRPISQDRCLGRLTLQ